MRFVGRLTSKQQAEIAVLIRDWLSQISPRVGVLRGPDVVERVASTSERIAVPTGSAITK